jgi:acetyl esterase/lipase
MQPRSPYQRRRTGPLLLVVVVIAAIIGVVAWRVASRHHTPAAGGAGGGVQSGGAGQGGAASGQSSQNGASGPVQVTEVSNVHYGSASLEVLDVYMNKKSSSQPAVVMVHGGGWHNGDKSQVAKDAQGVAQDGFTVFNIDYTLDSTSQAGYPMEVQQVEAAVHWVIANGAKYGADAQKLDLVGGSAGGQLVDLAAPLLNSQQPHTVTAVVSLSAPTDFISLIPLLQRALSGSSASAYIKHEFNFNDYFGCNVTQQPSCASSAERSASPALAVTASDCPKYFILNSQRELVPLSQAKEFDSNLQRLGCNPQMTVVPGRYHAFKYFSAEQTPINQFLKSNS